MIGNPIFAYSYLYLGIYESSCPFRLRLFHFLLFSSPLGHCCPAWESALFIPSQTFSSLPPPPTPPRSPHTVTPPPNPFRRALGLGYFFLSCCFFLFFGGERERGRKGGRGEVFVFEFSLYFFGKTYIQPSLPFIAPRTLLPRP